MYPLKEGALWPQNHWYIAGWSSEFGEKPVERTLLGQKVMLLRSEKGEPVVLAGLCPHRFMPLAQGVRTGDCIECPYHGMTFDVTGACVSGPAESPVSSAMRIRSFAVIEQAPYVWAWMGDADKADPAKMPDTSRCGIATDGWRVDPNEKLHFKARYMLIMDNLFDLSHIAWVHSSLLGKPSICTQAVVVSTQDCILRADRWETAEVDPFTRMLFPECVGPVEQQLGTEFLGPGLVTAIGPAVREGKGSPIEGKDWGTVHFIHGFTPETASTTHMFPAVSRNFRLDDHGLSAALIAQNKAVIEQDQEASRIIEEGLAMADTRSEIIVRSDRAGIEARRLIQGLIDQEQPANG